MRGPGRQVGDCGEAGGDAAAEVVAGRQRGAEDRELAARGDGVGEEVDGGRDEVDCVRAGAGGDVARVGPGLGEGGDEGDGAARGVSPAGGRARAVLQGGDVAQLQGGGDRAGDEALEQGRGVGVGEGGR